MANAIPQTRWIWDGHPGHYILADRCNFHMLTRVGHFIVSTVGEYTPTNPNRRTTGKTLGGELYEQFESIGAGRLFESFVFKANLADDNDTTPAEFMEIDALPANDHDSARQNHMSLCRKYARLRQEGASA